VPDFGAPSDQIVRQANLRIVARDVALGALPLPVSLRGNLDARGTFTGNLQSPNLALEVGLRGASLGGYAAPNLRGPVRWREGQISADLAGGADRWQVVLRPDERGIALVNLAVVSGGATVTARDGFYDYAQGLERLSAEVADLDLGQLVLPPRVPIGRLEGLVDARVDLRRAGNGALQGEAQVEARRTQVGELPLGTLRLEVGLQDEEVRIAPTTVELNGSRYRLAGRVGLSRGGPLDLRLAVENGRLQQVVRLLRFSSLSALLAPRPTTLDGAEELGTLGLGGAGLPLSDLLALYRRAARVTLARMDAMTRPLIPDDLRQLRGRFDLELSLDGSRAAPNARFALRGRNWRWGGFRLETATALGRYTDGVLTLETAEARYGERFGALRGTLALVGDQDARLVVRRLPLALIEPALPDTLRLRGDLDIEAQITGTLRQPTVTSQVLLAELSVNGRALDPVRTAVSVREGRAFLQSTTVGGARGGIEVSGSLPIPFLDPANREIALTVRLQGQDLPLLNALSNQLTWQAAQGQVNVGIGGTFEELTIDGTVDLGETVIAIAPLQTRLAVERVVARFDRRRLLLEQFRGSLGGASIAAEGALALRRRNDTGEALTVTLGGTLDLPDIYRGGIAGTLRVSRALLAPRLGGAVALNPGDLLLGLSDLQALTGGNGLRSGTNSATNNGRPRSPLGLPVAFDGLQVRIGPQFRVAIATLDARLDGRITLDGTLARLTPTGYIDVPQGSLTIGAARFRLDPTRRNALFFDSDLDPRLDLIAQATVSDFRPTGVARLDSSQLFRSSVTPTVEQTTLGRLERVEVRATITGTASDPDIELSSSPRRDEAEIIALIGGGGGGGSLLTGLVPAVGGTILRPVETGLASLLGLDELRFEFASQVASVTPQNFSVGFGVEAIKDLGPAISISVFRNLSDNLQPTLFGVRYRLNEQIVTRVSTNSALDDVSVSVQFETRF
jgi:translocation and assembly module TamB